MNRPPRILYLNTAPGDRIQGMTLAGIRRYAAARRWEVESVPWQASRPEDIPALLAAHRPVAGCVIECADGDSRLLPQLFGKVPTVYLHAAMSFCGGRVARVSADNEAVARAAFRELSAGRPAAYAVVEAGCGLAWADIRSHVFQELAARAGIPCQVFACRKEPIPEREVRLADMVGRLPQKCAIFAVNDRTATDVVAAARATHRSIPHELTLLGVDNNVAVCEASDPPISSVQIDHERAGFLAARLLGGHISRRGTETRSQGKHTDLLPPNGVLEKVSRVNGEQIRVLNKKLCGSVALCDKCYTVGPLMSVWRESTRGAGRREPHILAAVELIRRRACDGISAEEVIASAPGSRSLFNLRFREATGHSVLEEIRHVRLEKVETLLSQTGTPLGAIADLCGWGASVTLQRFFRSRTGMTMREWRCRNRG